MWKQWVSTLLVAWTVSNSVASPVCASKCSDNPLVVSTQLGAIQGVASGTNSQRFTLPFAQPPAGQLRFASPQPVTSWNGTLDGTKLPASCMQDLQAARQSNPSSEDCLYLNIYRPASVSSSSSLPVLVWIHGGSFIEGSSSAVGLDGSKLASNENMIVVTIQYRLGAFGFFQTSQLLDESAKETTTKVAGNQGVRDVVQALSFLEKHVGSFGGDANQITVAGQSSGAHMVRTLLTTTAAQPLFARAILHSDPANYGAATADTMNKVGQYTMEQSGCSTLECMRHLSAEDLLTASMTASGNMPQMDPAVAQGEPFRPTLGQYIPLSIENQITSSQTNTNSKPILLTNVANEMGSAVGQLLAKTPAGADSLHLSEAYGPVSQYPMDRASILEMEFNGGRGKMLANEATYQVTPQQHSEKDGLRINVEKISTDGLYKCGTWITAMGLGSIWSSPVYLAQIDTGITYPTNAGGSYCSLHRSTVCHEDDIYLVFGTAPDSSKLTAAQASTAREVQARWGAFIKTGSPNTSKYGGWQPIGSSSSSALPFLFRLGANYATGESNASVIPTDSACHVVWGSHVRLDWQLYSH